MNGRHKMELEAPQIPRVLPRSQREALRELAHRGPSREFDPIAMSALYTAGLIELVDGRVALTDLGREAANALGPATEHRRRRRA